MSTTKAQVDRVLTEVDVFTSNAAQLIRSFMPGGLGPFWLDEERELVQMLDQVNARFKRAIRKGQKKGWANE